MNDHLILCLFVVLILRRSIDIDRAKLIDLMKEDGIQTSIHYPAIQSFTAYKSQVGPTPKSQYISDHELTLPLYPTMTDAEVDLVCDSLEKNLPKCRK